MKDYLGCCYYFYVILASHGLRLLNWFYFPQLFLFTLHKILFHFMSHLPSSFLRKRLLLFFDFLLVRYFTVLILHRMFLFLIFTYIFYLIPNISNPYRFPLSMELFLSVRCLLFFLLLLKVTFIIVIIICYTILQFFC